MSKFVDAPGLMPVELRGDGSEMAMFPSPPNGGLYGGPQSTKPWANIPVVPTIANLIHQNLRSANPPPGATEQYPSTERLGNNYMAMPGIRWYNAGNGNIYYIQGI